MTRNNNSLAGYAAAMVKNAFAFVCVLVMVVVTTTFASCESEVDTLVEPVPTTPTTPEDPTPEEPEIVIESIDHYGCDFGALSWTAENAAFTRSAGDYDLANRDGGVFAIQNATYLAEVTYSDGSVKNANQKYSVNHSVAGFGYKGTHFVANGAMAAFESDPSVKVDGDVTFLTWGDETIAFRTVSENSVKSVTIAGKEMTDLCEASVKYAYDRTEVIAEGDSADFAKYVVRVYGTATVSDGANNTKGFYIEMAYREAKSSSVVPPTEDEKEAVKYDVVNKDITSDGATGELEVIYSDGSRENLGRIDIALNKSTFVNEEQTINVINFDYNRLEASYGHNIRTGNVRNDNQLGCQINITEMKNTIIMKTTKAVVTMGGLFEYPVLIDPLGGEHAWDIEGWNLTEVSITDDGGNGNVMVLTYTADAYYVGSETLQSIVNLVKEESVDPTPEQPTVQTGAYAKDAHIEGAYIKWTLVRTYNNADNTETAMSIRHMGNLSVETRKSTTDRTYATATPAMNLVSSENFQDGNYSGTFCKYTSHFVYADFTNEIASEGRTVVNYTDNGYTISVWNEGLLVEKNGVERGVENISSDSNIITYLDLINYRLTNGGTEVAAGKQEVAYSEQISTPEEPEEPAEPEDIVSKDITFDRISNGNLYFIYSETHSQKPELNVTEEGFVALVFDLNVTAVNDWTAKAGATGFALTGSATQNYSGAKDYTFASNRGNNIVSASLETSYTVSAHGYSETLTISGSISGATALVSSSTDANTYSFTGRLFANGVEIASASDNAVETIEKEQQEEPSTPEDPSTPEEPGDNDDEEKDSWEMSDFGITAVYSTVAWGFDNRPHVTMAARYDNGNCVLFVDGKQVYKGAAPSGTISAIPTNGGWQAASITASGNTYRYVGVNGGLSVITLQDITYNGYPSGILGVSVNVDANGVHAVNNYTSATFVAY